MDIYYTDDGNRGVKYANGAIGEANDAFVPFGLLVEVAYHDNVNDAKWIMENKKIIGNTIAYSILKYFGIDTKELDDVVEEKEEGNNDK